MLKYLAILVLALSLSACEETKEGPIKTEDVEVVQLAYVPATSGETSGGLVSAGGNVGMSFPQTVTTDEVWAVVVRCSDHHKVFSIRNKSLYDSVKVGSIVKINYVEIWAYNTSDMSKTWVVGYKTKGIGDIR